MKFFRSLFASRKRTPTRAQRRHRLRVALARKPLRPLFERLEERRVLATVVWDGGGGDFQWGNDLNWSTDAQPQLVDDVEIGSIGSPVQVNVPVSIATIDAAVGIVVGGLTSFQVVTGNFAGGFSVTASNSINLGTSTVAGGSWNSATVNGIVTNTGNLSFPVLTVNFGQIINAGSISITSNSSGVITNQSTASLSYSGGTHSGSITNAGNLDSNGTVTINASLDNTGVVNVTGGTLTLNGAVTQHVGATLTGGRWEANNGTLDLATGSNITSLAPGASVVLSGSGAFAKLDSLNLNQGEFVVLNRNYSTAGPFNNQGYVQLTNAVLNTGANAYTQSASPSAVTQLENSANVSASSFHLNSGFLFGNGSISSSVTNAATIAPGLSPGVIFIAGNYTQTASGVLNIEVQGTNVATPDFDQIIVTGTATLDGTLNVSLLNNFLPDKSEAFRIIQAASRTGDFATKNLPQRNGQNLVSTTLGANFYELQGKAYIVRNTNDSGSFSLRDQLTLANGSLGLDQVLLNIPEREFTPFSRCPCYPLSPTRRFSMRRLSQAMQARPSLNSMERAPGPRRAVFASRQETVRFEVWSSIDSDWMGFKSMVAMTM